MNKKPTKQIIILLAFVATTLLAIFLGTNKEDKTINTDTITNSGESDIVYSQGYTPPPIHRFHLDLKENQESRLPDYQSGDNKDLYLEKILTSNMGNEAYRQTSYQAAKYLLENYTIYKIETPYDALDKIAIEQGGKRRNNFYYIETPDSIDYQELIKGFKSLNLDANINYEKPMTIFYIPNDPKFNNQRGIGDFPGARLEKAFELIQQTNTELSATNVAIQDDGFDSNHEDLGTIQTQQGGVGPHGTAVAGIVAATTNNSKGIASPQLTNKINLHVAQGLSTHAALNLALSSQSKVVNMSFGMMECQPGCLQKCGSASDSESEYKSRHFNSTTQAAINQAHNAGVLIVAAAANGPCNRRSVPGDARPYYPALYDNVMAVGNLKNSDQKSTSSNYGPSLDIMAAGEGTYSTDITGPGGYGGGNYAEFGGTSSASPRVASCAALLFSIDPNLSNTEVWNILTDTAKPVENDSLYDQGLLGAGRLDCCAAVATVLGASNPNEACETGTIGCEIGSTEECTPDPDQYKGVCAEGGTQTCEDPDDDGLAGERGECIPNIQPGEQEENDSADTCTDGVDNDCDGFVDCGDYPNCTTGADRIQCELEESICNDGGDNDGDGDRDCADQDCDGALVTGDDVDDYYCEYEQELSCSDGADNDGDGDIDCDDQADCGVIVEIERSDNGGEICGTANNQITLTATGLSTTGITSIVREPTGETEREINIEVTQPVTYTATVLNFNGCTGTQSITIEHRPSSPEICDSGIDEDCDGLIDCDDEEDCENSCRSCADAGFDCNDPACQDQSYCDSVENNCCDGLDNDGDGSIDCNDPECQGQPGCPLNGSIGSLGFNTKAFQQFQAIQQTVEGSLYIDFGRRTPEGFEEKIKKNLKAIKLYQPFIPLNIDTYRIDFDTDIYTEKTIREYIEKTFSRDRPTAFNVPNFKVSNFISNDTLVHDQRYLNHINIQDFEGCTEPKKKTKIAIVDNGFDLQHEDLQLNNIQGYDIADNDTDVSIPRALNQRNHGTIARGIVNAVTNNNKGIAGIVNNNSEIILIKATNDDKKGTDVTAGIEGLVKAADMGADIINISWGTFQEIPLLEKVVKQLKKKGIIMVASAGNYSSSTPFYPAAYDEVIAVGAHDENQNIAIFSNYGKRVDVYAPGTNITTTNIRNNYISIDGTSEAAPIVTATLALAKTHNIKTDAIFQTNGDYQILNTENICNVKNLKNENKTRKNIRPLLTITIIIAIIGTRVFKNTLTPQSNDEK